MRVKFESANSIIKAKVVMEDGLLVPFSQAVLYEQAKTNSTSKNANQKEPVSTVYIKNGDLKFNILKPGVYSLGIGLDPQSSKKGRLMMDVKVAKDEEIDLWILNLRTDIVLTGRIVNENFAPVAQAKITAFVKGHPIKKDTWKSNENGEFKLTGFPNLETELMVKASEYLSKKVKVVGNNITVQLEKAPRKE